MAIVVQDRGYVKLTAEGHVASHRMFLGQGYRVRHWAETPEYVSAHYVKGPGREIVAHYPSDGSEVAIFGDPLRGDV